MKYLVIYRESSYECDYAGRPYNDNSYHIKITDLSNEDVTILNENKIPFNESSFSEWSYELYKYNPEIINNSFYENVINKANSIEKKIQERINKDEKKMRERINEKKSKPKPKLNKKDIQDKIKLLEDIINNAK